jgi:cytochrome P450
MPGAWRPVIGNLPEMAQYETVSAQSDEPLPILFRWIVEYFIDPEDRTTLKYENRKGILMNLFGSPLIWITNPESAQEVFQTKNKIVDKTGVWQQVFEDLMPSAFVFQKGDDEWAAKRKASAHAFSRERLSNMMEVLKDQLMKKMDQWMSEIEACPDKKTMIDIATVFEDILTTNILTINFGEDISQT